MEQRHNPSDQAEINDRHASRWIPNKAFVVYFSLNKHFKIEAFPQKKGEAEALQIQENTKTRSHTNQHEKSIEIYRNPNPSQKNQDPIDQLHSDGREKREGAMDRSLQRPDDESGERSSTPCLLRISSDGTSFEEKTLEMEESE